MGKTVSNSIACYRYITGEESTDVASCIVVLLKNLPQSPQRLLNMNKFCEVFHSSGKNKIHMHILAMKYDCTISVIPHTHEMPLHLLLKLVLSKINMNSKIHVNN